jgi:hypothetical protein
MRDHRLVRGRTRQLDRIERFGEGADLVELDQDRVRDVLVDPALQPLDIGDEDVIANKLEPLAEPIGQESPALPLVLGEAVLERHERIAVGEILVHLDHRLGVELQPLAWQAVDAVREEPGGRRVESEDDVARMAGTVDRLEDRFERRLARREIGRAKPPSSPTPVESPRSCSSVFNAW